MEDNDGLTRVLTTEELATLLSLSSRRIRLAVVNSCESAEHAAAAVGHLDAAIGMDQPIGDAAAQSFAGQLYRSIAFGLPLSTAFAQAVLQVRLVLGEGSGEPELFVAQGLDGDRLVVVPREVVDGDAADRRSSTEGCVGSVMVVGVQPLGKAAVRSLLEAKGWAYAHSVSRVDRPGIDGGFGRPLVSWSPIVGSSCHLTP